ncbi:MAG TPA: glycosyl hydrolase [Bacteroidales bacterium]|nr:glycosyl hydrolase [Bacteroidales bacterium]
MSVKTILLFVCFLFAVFISNAQQSRSFKRGLAYSIPYPEDLPTLGKGISWFYSWGQTPGLAVASIFDPYMDFIPMAWNGLDTVVMKNFYSTHPNIKYILGFNEPNFKQQANLTPTQAAAKWKYIERIADLYDLKIVGPAVNYAPANGAVSENGVTYTDPIRYLDDFFKACPNCRVDYIAVHNYMNSESALEGDIARYKKYQKPIWLTEFCAYNSNQGLTPDLQKDYMVEALSYLENDTSIYRYSWFIGRNGAGETAFPYNSLLTNDDRGVLTELGSIYINMSSFDKNFYFTTLDTIQAEDFSNSHSASLRQLDAVSGNLYLNNFFFKDWATYQINVPESKEYTITFRMACIDVTTLQILDSEGALLKSQDMASTGGLNSWGFRTLTVFLPAGKQTLQLKSMGEGCQVDWFTFSDINVALLDSESAPSFRLFSNSSHNVLNVESPLNTKKISIMDSLGRVVYQGTNERQIDTSHFARGVYMVRLVFDNNVSVSTKMIK